MVVAVDSVRGLVQMVAILVNRADRNPVGKIVGIRADIVQLVLRPSACVKIPFLRGAVDGRLVPATGVDLVCLRTRQYARHDRRGD